MNDYIYLGDRYTDEQLKNSECNAVRNHDGKCIRGKNGNMLVNFPSFGCVVVRARLLRRCDKIGVPKKKKVKQTKLF